SIAAASVIAKVTRDRLMREFCAQFPEYCFGQHKGYGTELHLIKLHEHGPCPIHRRSFEPVAQPLLALDLMSCRANYASPARTSCSLVRAEKSSPAVFYVVRAIKFSTAISGLGTAARSTLFAAMATHSSSSK